MSAIYGLVRFGGAPAASAELRAMRDAIAHWGPDGGGEWLGGGAGLGQLVLRVTPESLHETGPLVGRDVILTAAARLDNRDDLLGHFDLPQTTTESELILRAYEEWRDDTPLHLFGDWAFAAWHPGERRLFLARDHFGNTAMYYHRDANALAFASGRNAILALPHVPRTLDELRLAQQLTLWITDAHRTSYEGVHRLPPAHRLVLRETDADTHEYWKMGEAPPVRLGSDDEYIERFLELYERAVRVRLRSIRPIASTLSAGLDSGSVTAFAARQLRAKGETLTSFTAVPLYPRELQATMPDVLFDEWPLAHETATWCGNVEHLPIRADTLTPVQAIDRYLAAHEDPEGGASNLFWAMDLLDQARKRNSGVLLTGQFGNGGVSWTGDSLAAVRSLLAGDLRRAWRAVRNRREQQRASWLRAVNRTIVRPFFALRRMRAPQQPIGNGLINPAFERRHRIAERMRETGVPGDSARAMRLMIMLPGISPAGALWHESGAGAGLDARDPTGDVRLLEFCLGIPEDLFLRDEADRWLMRRAMTGILPPSVQWNVRRGRQSADLTYRLRADAAAVSALIAEITASRRAAEVLDLAALQRRWAEVSNAASKTPFAAAVAFAASLLTGAFVARFGD